jgi:hypothetical protein
MYSWRLRGVKPQFLETMIFWRPGNCQPISLRPSLTSCVTYLVLATPQSLKGDGAVVVPCPDGHENLANVDTSDKTVGLAESTTHTRLQSIGTSARQHLVDTDDVVGVDADTEMEGFLSTVLDEVLVGANTGGLERLRGQLLVLVGDQVDAEREVVYVGLLATKVEDTDLGIGNTTVEPALGVLRPSQPVILLSRYLYCDVRACSCSSGSNGRDGEPL